MGLWEPRGKDLFLPDDRPANPGELVRAVSGSAALTISREGSSSASRYQPGGVCLLGCDAVHGALEQRAVAAEREELFRPLLPAAGPEPRPAAAGHNHRV